MNGSAQPLPLPIPEGFDTLSVTEKLRFLEELWERTEATEDASDLHEQVVARVSRARREELLASPGTAISRDEVMRRVRERLAR